MGRNRTQYIPLDDAATAELKGFIASGNGFRRISAAEIPSAVPSSLRDKWSSATVIVSGSTGADGAVLILGDRADEKAGKLDHDPFALGVAASAPNGSGVLIHHADYPGRSISLPPQFVDAANSSGLFDYLRNSLQHGQSSGTTGEAPAPLVDALAFAKRYLTPSSAG